MEQCFRIALWMIFLTGYLQARPMTTGEAKQGTKPQEKPFPFTMGDLGFDYLTNVSCEPTVTFISPTKVSKSCYAAALERLKEGLKHAGDNCRDEENRTEDTLEAFIKQSTRLRHLQSANSSQCKWEKKQFPSFVDDFKTFVEQLNSESLKKS